MRTEILCPECMKKKLLLEGDEGSNKLFCDECGTDFILTAPNTVRYRKISDDKKSTKI